MQPRFQGAGAGRILLAAILIAAAYIVGGLIFAVLIAEMATTLR